MMMKKILLAITLILCSVTVAAQNDTLDDDRSLVFGQEIDPEFPGGIDSLYGYLCRNLSYPAEAREQGITGKVYVTFVIERDGSVADVRILRDIGGGCGEAVVEAVRNMPRWKPATLRGKPIRTQFNLPVNFSLEEDEDPATKDMTREEACLYRYLKNR